MKFNDGGEVDDKVIAVLNDDKRVAHIKTLADLGEYFQKETTYYWEHYKDLKKPGTCTVDGFFDTAESKRIIDECTERYQKRIRAETRIDSYPLKKTLLSGVFFCYTICDWPKRCVLISRITKILTLPKTHYE
jgi:hypothetical protein